MGRAPSATRSSARAGSIAAISRSPASAVGNVAVLIQPARGYNIDPKATYHDPALVPPHAYLASYAWLADSFGADAVIHLGKHGNLEWLPGKAMALSADASPRSRSARCRISIRSSSTIPARAPRPSAAPRRSSSIT